MQVTADCKCKIRNNNGMTAVLVMMSRKYQSTSVAHY